MDLYEAEINVYKISEDAQVAYNALIAQVPAKDRTRLEKMIEDVLWDELRTRVSHPPQIPIA